MNKMLYAHHGILCSPKKEGCSKTWLNFLSKLSQTQKDKYMIPVTGSASNSWIHREGKHSSSSQGRGRGWALAFEGCSVSFGVMRNFWMKHFWMRIAVTAARWCECTKRRWITLLKIATFLCYAYFTTTKEVLKRSFCETWDVHFP